VLPSAFSFSVPSIFTLYFIDLDAIFIDPVIFLISSLYYAPLESSVAYCRIETGDSGRCDTAAFMCGKSDRHLCELYFIGADILIRYLLDYYYASRVTAGNRKYICSASGYADIHTCSFNLPLTFQFLPLASVTCWN
jgi:hypothetical protein